jgi:predicted dehydrogenase
MAKKATTTKWRAVLVGCGSMSRAWVEAVKATPNLELVGLVDLIPQSAEKLAVDHALTNAVVGSDLDAVLTNTRANLLFVCTVPDAHKSNILAGLKHGCHVLTEKPLASTMAEARALVAAARKAKRVVAVMQNYRYRRDVRSVKKFLATQKIGTITGLDADFYIGAHFGGFREEMKHVLLLDMSIHLFDIARFLAGQNPVAVTAQEWNPKNSWFGHAASAAALFEFENGMVFNFRGSWCSQGFDTDWPGTWRILGEKGCVRWAGPETIEAEVVAERTGFVWKKKPVPISLLPDKLFPQGHVMVVREFIRCLDQGTEPETIIVDNIHSLAMVHGAIASASKQRRIALSSLL